MATKQKILIVDDDSNIAELISLYLTKEFYEVQILSLIHIFLTFRTCKHFLKLTAHFFLKYPEIPFLRYSFLLSYVIAFRQECLFLIKMKFFVKTPVSYTHLDVYKRQLQYSGSRRLHEAEGPHGCDAEYRMLPAQ